MLYEKLSKHDPQVQAGARMFQFAGRTAFRTCLAYDANLQEDADSYTVPTLAWLNQQAQQKGLEFTFVASPVDDYTPEMFVSALRRGEILVSMHSFRFHDFFFHWVPNLLFLTPQIMPTFSRLLQRALQSPDAHAISGLVELLTPAAGMKTSRSQFYHHPLIHKFQANLQDPEFDSALQKLRQFLEQDLENDSEIFWINRLVQEVAPEAHAVLDFQEDQRLQLTFEYQHQGRTIKSTVDPGAVETRLVPLLKRALRYRAGRVACDCTPYRIVVEIDFTDLSHSWVLDRIWDWLGAERCPVFLLLSRPE